MSDFQKITRLVSNKAELTVPSDFRVHASNYFSISKKKKVKGVWLTRYHPHHPHHPHKDLYYRSYRQLVTVREGETFSLA